MGEVKEINIKNRTYYYFDDMIDIRNFHSDFDIYNIGYNTIKKFSNCDCDCDCDYENIRSVEQLYLIVHSATGYFKEKNGEKCLIIDSTEKYGELFSGIRSEIKTINGEKELFYEKNYVRTGANINDDLPLNKLLKFSTLTIIIR